MDHSPGRHCAYRKQRLVNMAEEFLDQAEKGVFTRITNSWNDGLGDLL